MPERELQLEDLCREAQFTLRAADDDDGDGLTIDGYAAVYDVPTRIDSWEGTFDEQIQFGAFRKSLRERVPKLQFDHGHHPLIGSLPIGRWDSISEEQGAGLHTVGRLHNNWLVEPVRDAIREGSVDGMSFRFSVVREEWRDAQGKVLRDRKELMDLLWGGDPERVPLQRTLKEVKITEAGPVVWPAYQQTSVGVRSKVTIDLGRLGDPGERSKLAEAVYIAEAATRTEPSTDDAPPPNQDKPAEHPTATPEVPDAPPVSEPSSGEHPSPAGPVNPTQRAADLKARYRTRVDRYLAVSQSS